MSSGLGNFEGILQTDGYAAYDHVGGPEMVYAGCWAHARRKFFQAAELNPKDQLAIGIVAQIDELFNIDQRAREQGLSKEARHALRLANTQALVEEIRSRIETARSSALPKSLLAKACHYTLTLWPRLTRFLQYPELQLSNNWAENAIRPVALGRKIGSTAAKKPALVLPR
jgi:transposase